MARAPPDASWTEPHPSPGARPSRNQPAPVRSRTRPTATYTNTVGPERGGVEGRSRRASPRRGRAAVEIHRQARGKLPGALRHQDRLVQAGQVLDLDGPAGHPSPAEIGLV